MSTPSALLDPDVDSGSQGAGDMKSGVINPAHKQTRYLRIPNVRGRFGAVMIGDDGITETAVSPEVAEKIKKHFMGVEEVDPPKGKT